MSVGASSCLCDKIHADERGDAQSATQSISTGTQRSTDRVKHAEVRDALYNALRARGDRQAIKYTLTRLECETEHYRASEGGMQRSTEQIGGDSMNREAP